MDVVKCAVESMNGHIDVKSVRGVGTKFSLSLPLIVVTTTALMAQTRSERYVTFAGGARSHHTVLHRGRDIESVGLVMIDGHGVTIVALKQQGRSIQDAVTR